MDAVWVLRYAAPWRVVCRDRRVAADASRPPACLSVRLHLTGGDIGKSAHAGGRTHTHRHTHIYAAALDTVLVPVHSSHQCGGLSFDFDIAFSILLTL